MQGLEQQHQVNQMQDSEMDHLLTVPSQPDATFDMTQTSSASLAEFFARPILVTSFLWRPTVPLSAVVIDPWYQYFTDKRVSNRMCNYNLARARMHVKISLNGNQFYFGRLMASYQPMLTTDEFVAPRPILNVDNVRFSQRPHIFLDPSTSGGGEMVLPFVWPFNAVALPLGDFSNLGQIIITELNVLQNSASNLKPITVNVFAWCEDMQLSVPTSQNTSGLVPQAGEEKGMISTPAAALAGVARSLKTVPSIRPYAMASEIALTALAAVAKVFGYSRPVSCADIVPMLPNYGNFANTNATETLHRISLDQKAEVCLDSRVVGLDGRDEMAIKAIATRESYLTTFAWPTIADTNVLLWNTRILPVLSQRPPAPYFDEIHMTALAFVSVPFRYWRGSLRYRFQVVSAGPHRGRLRFVWEPRYPVSPTEINLAHNRIVDISIDKDFVIEIGWGSFRPWLRVNDLPTAHELYGTNPIVTEMDLFSNGTLSVYVQNELSSFSNTAGVANTVNVNVFVSASDDFELAAPSDRVATGLSYFAPPGIYTVPDPIVEEVPLQSQSGAEEITTDHCCVPFAPPNIYTMGKRLDGTDDIYKVMLPDPVGSIRQVLKRYCFHSAIIPDAHPGVVNISSETRSIFPAYRGYDPSSPDTSVGPIPYAFSNTTFLNWFTPAYACRRGSIRWKLLNTGPNGDNPNTHNFLTAAATYSRFFSRGKLLVPATSTANQIRAAFVNSVTGLSPTFAGFVTQPSKLNPMIQIEFPHYSPRRFYNARAREMILEKVDGVQLQDFFSVSQFQEPSSAGTNNTILTYVAAGDDYNLSFYIGPPIVFSYANPDSI